MWLERDTGESETEKAAMVQTCEKRQRGMLRTVEEMEVSGKRRVARPKTWGGTTTLGLEVLETEGIALD